MLTAVTYLYIRRHRNTTVSVTIVVSQEIRRTRRQPAETNFSHPDCGESLLDLLRGAAVLQGILYEPPRKYGCRNLVHLPWLLRP